MIVNSIGKATQQYSRRMKTEAEIPDTITSNNNNFYIDVAANVTESVAITVTSFSKTRYAEENILVSACFISDVCVRGSPGLNHSCTCVCLHLLKLQ